MNPKTRKQKPADSVKTAKAMLDAGLDPNREAFREGTWKATPLWYAVGCAPGFRKLADQLRSSSSST